MEIGEVHPLHSERGDVCVVHGLHAVGRLGFLLFPSVDSAQTALIVVAQAMEVVEGRHLHVRPGGSGWQFLADGVENAKARFLFDTLGERLFRTLLPFLWGRLIARDCGVHGALFVLADLEQPPGVLAVNYNRWQSRRAFSGLLGPAKLSFVESVRRAVGLPCGCL